ncbi:M3 family oligoendopeptidase [Marinicrinis sediminis]|uniref:M3 family oligoendopeptidase n=1 Tax=Marinicrinis sediminis TaxID=1652465 RepID=A0ABW5R6U7_9BACL
MTLNHPLPQRWNLDRIFEGGSASESFQAFLSELQQDLNTFAGMLQIEGSAEQLAQQLEPLTDQLQSLQSRLLEGISFADCLSSNDMKDHQAVRLGSKMKELLAEYENALNRFDQWLLKTEASQLKQLLADAGLSDITYPVMERREWAAMKLDADKEALIQDLALDGYHGWAEHYNTIVSRLSFQWEEDGKPVQLSAGQAANKLGSKEEAVRSRMFAEWERVWGEHADLFADTLNRVAGYRLNMYKHRNWEVLQEPLHMNRMSEQTLQVMWQVISEQKSRFLPYLERKAKLLGKDKLSWVDVDAPVGEASKTYSYDEAAAFIVAQFGKQMPKLATFAEMAFEEGWIEAEDRSGKRPGGFCTSFPESEETRIFMTFDGSPSNVSTLAHELGHGFHQYVMDDLPPLAQNYAMNVAETASTLAEWIVSDAAVKAADSEEERISLLDEKLQRSVAFYMNIHARFLFETRFYEKRKQGVVSAEELNEWMMVAQREAYADALQDEHPHFWASKLHFYLTDVPFYNFPYTFGYLFSAGLYAEAEKQGEAFEERYIALLRDTGIMKVEDLAMKHLGVDLTHPGFWEAAIALTARDLDEFLALTQ